MPSLLRRSLVERLRCPQSGARLRVQGDRLVTVDGRWAYPLVDGAPDLRVPPASLTVDLPWVEPWEDLDGVLLEAPEPVEDRDLPYHLDPHLAAGFERDGAGRSVLEIGCGERQCEPYFAERDYDYVGVDVDARGGGPSVLADAHNLPFADGSFDVCTSMAVFEHLVSPLQAALEINRVLRPGGRFHGTAAFVYGFHDRASFHHMTHAGLIWTLRSAGFRVERMWADWSYADSIADMGFHGRHGAPWRFATASFLRAMEWSFTRASNAARRLAGKRPLDLAARSVETAGSISFVAERVGVATSALRRAS